MQYDFILLLSGTAIILAILVYLMYRSATSPEWSELSKKEKSEMRKLSEPKAKAKKK